MYKKKINLNFKIKSNIDASDAILVWNWRKSPLRFILKTFRLLIVSIWAIPLTPYFNDKDAKRCNIYESGEAAASEKEEEGYLR